MKKTSVFLFTLMAAVFCGPKSPAQVSVIGELTQEKETRPGDRYEGTILVKNDTKEPQEAKIYQTDYLFKYDGTNEYGEPGSAPRSNASWIGFSPSYLTLPPEGSVEVSFTVTVPLNAQGHPLIGTYWSMLMVEGIAQGSPESSAHRKKGEMGIQQTIRYGIQIVSHIAQTGTKKIEFLDTKLVAKPEGGRILQVDIENTGDIGVRPEMYAELFNEKGASQGRFPGVRYRIYPGTSVRQIIDLSTVPAGTYKVMVVVDAGGDDVYGAQYTLKF